METLVSVKEKRAAQEPILKFSDKIEEQQKILNNKNETATRAKLIFRSGSHL